MAALGVGLIAGLTYVTGYICIRKIRKNRKKGKFAILRELVFNNLSVLISAYERRMQGEIFTISTGNIDPIRESNRIQLTRNNFVSVESISPVNRSYNDGKYLYKFDSCINFINFRSANL